MDTLVSKVAALEVESGNSKEMLKEVKEEIKGLRSDIQSLKSDVHEISMAFSNGKNFFYGMGIGVTIFISMVVGSVTGAFKAIAEGVKGL